ncbi:MAG: LAGLIDADG family homing endonuclease [Thermodesulfobacteriota bacterium]
MRRTYWIAINKNLDKEQFCEILDALPLRFKFKLKNVSHEIDGEWEKEYVEKNPDLKETHPIWHNITNDSRIPSSSSFFVFKDKVLDSIHLKNTNYYEILAQILTKKKLESLYFDQKKSLEDIANAYTCSRQMIRRHMGKYGIERRTQSKARMEAIKKGKFEKFEYDDINENFFGVWSPEMSWVLGLLFTDGNVSPGRISLSSIDIELLEKVKTLLNSTKPLIRQVQSYDKSKCVYRFEFYREKMREDLNRLGLHQRKSLNMIFPNVPEEYVRHFIRGCWDGDGSIFISGGKMNANYTCGSFGFIDRLVQELYKIGIHKRRPPLDKVEAGKIWLNYPDDRFPVILTRVPLTMHKAKRSKSYYIKIDAKENLEKLFNYFYDGVNESMYLERKFEIFAKGLGVLTGGLQEV